MIARPATLADLPKILALQKENLEQSVDAAEAREQGFVTVVHTLEKLKQMHALAPSIVAGEGDELLGYAITMPVATRALIPVLDPMFAQIEKLPSLQGRRWYVMGQICVAKRARGQGVFTAMYDEHARRYADQFDLIVTEIADRNTRSLRAHQRQGFEVIHRYSDATDDWSVVAWNFARP
jgi:L-amino acid N-acyltransferase YncA